MRHTLPGQLEMPETESRPAEHAKQKAGAPLRPSTEQKPCDVGLFSDDGAQLDLIDQLRGMNMDAKTFDKLSTAQKASELWTALDANEKAGIRFGLFPFVKMQAAEKEGFNGKDLCVALMDCAQRDGGMRA